VLLTSFDLSELVRDKQRQESVIVRIDGDVERDELIEEDQGVDDCRDIKEGQRESQKRLEEEEEGLTDINEIEEEEDSRPKVRLRSVLATRERLPSEEGIQKVLPEGTAESIGDLRIYMWDGR